MRSSVDYNEFKKNGCVELNRTALECSEQAGYHIDVDAVVMEFISDGKVAALGECREIVYTGLYNYTMSLIRYKIEDLGVLSGKVCPMWPLFPSHEVH